MDIPISRSVDVNLILFFRVSINILESMGNTLLGVMMFCTVCIPFCRISFLI